MDMVCFTMVDGSQEQEIYVNPRSVSWVQRVGASQLPSPDGSEEQSSAGTLIHLVGQPTLPVTVTDPVDEVIRKLQAV